LFAAAIPFPRLILVVLIFLLPFVCSCHSLSQIDIGAILFVTVLFVVQMPFLSQIDIGANLLVTVCLLSQVDIGVPICIINPTPHTPLID